MIIKDRTEHSAQMLAVIKSAINANYRRSRLAVQQIRCDSSDNNNIQPEITTGETSDSTKRAGKSRTKIDKSRVPTLDEKDLEEQFVSGSGPGGQCVNKSVNCCQLKHKPTGIRVKVHQTRSLIENRKIARELLVEKLDDHFNGENSVSNQKKKLVLRRLALKEAQQERLKLLKDAFRKRNEDEESQQKESR